MIGKREQDRLDITEGMLNQVKNGLFVLIGLSEINKHSQEHNKMKQSFSEEDNHTVLISKPVQIQTITFLNAVKVERG